MMTSELSLEVSFLKRYVDDQKVLKNTITDLKKNLTELYLQESSRHEEDIHSLEIEYERLLEHVCLLNQRVTDEEQEREQLNVQIEQLRIAHTNKDIRNVLVGIFLWLIIIIVIARWLL